MAVPPKIDHAVIATLFQFRMATAEQLRGLHTGGRFVADAQAAAAAGQGGPGGQRRSAAGREQRTWFLTEHAVRIAATFPELEGIASPPLPEDRTAARLRVRHVLAVVRTHVTFKTGACAVGDKCAPRDADDREGRRGAPGRPRGTPHRRRRLALPRPPHAGPLRGLGL
ncbi:hypothetical protein [Kitasatospora sp. MBT66]|uniref:hypothetical protein n=1 Tax=Kitasatospora sp. MBT66 TaxID=1444769 RepID=UPI000691A360|nr:hypothetical protein [Kitasatospora sp. MBT66]